MEGPFILLFENKHFKIWYISRFSSPYFNASVCVFTEMQLSCSASFFVYYILAVFYVNTYVLFIEYIEFNCMDIAEFRPILVDIQNVSDFPDTSVDVLVCSAKNLGFEARQNWILLLLSVGPWAGYLTTPMLQFPHLQKGNTQLRIALRLCSVSHI